MKELLLSKDRETKAFIVYSGKITEDDVIVLIVNAYVNKTYTHPQALKVKVECV